MAERREGGRDRGAVHLRFRGRVQGVGFRYFVTRIATEYGVEGYVRNLSDGGVEIWAEGSSEALKRLVEAVSSGPELARVSSLERSDDVSTGSFQGFSVRY